MLKSKTIIIMSFGVVFATGVFLQTNKLVSSDADVLNSNEQGRVLGVSEEQVAKKPRNYLALDKLDEIIPIVKKEVVKPIKKEGTKNPSDLSWGSILAVDVTSGEVLYSRDADKKRSIASITKLVTALVLLDADIDWGSTYKIKSTDRIEGGRIYLRTGDDVKLSDLLHISLVASANTATRALVSASGYEYDIFIEKMNEKVAELGLVNTKLVDPIGLSSFNVSTANEIAKIVKEVMINGVIRECLQNEKYVFTTVSGVTKTVNSTNILLNDFKDSSIDMLGGKTGFTGAAGYCFTAMFDGRENNKVVTVVLGSQTHGGRFNDTEKLANWVYGNFEWWR